MRAAAISTPCAFLAIKPSLHHQLHPCGISGSGTPGTLLILKFYKLFPFHVIRLMVTVAVLAAWASTPVYLSAI